MKYKYIILGTTIVTVLSLVSLFNTVQATIETKKYPEPQSEFSKNKPSNVKWNEEKGEFYDSSIVIWDTDKKDYIPQKKVDLNLNSLKRRDYGAEQQEWLKKNKNSTNQLDKAIRNFRDAMNTKFDSSSSISNLNDNPEYQVFANLGIDGLKEMERRIKNDDPWSLIFERAMAYTMKISSLNDYVSEETNGVQKWTTHYQDVIKKAKIETKNALKDKKNLPDVIKNYGILTLPYLTDNIKNGNTENTEYLAQIGDKISKTEESQLKTYNADNWKTWLETNENSIEQIRELVESYN